MKYFATRCLVVDGKIYNQGDIVDTVNPVSGLKKIIEDQTAPRIEAKINPDVGGNTPLISVIITFHEQNPAICIESFLRQDIKVPYEIIAVCDKDSQSYEILGNYRNVKRFSVDFGHAGQARNFGMDQAKGDFLVFFDGDDEAYGNFLSEHYSALVNSDKDFSYSRFDHLHFGFNKFKLPRCNIFEWSDNFNKYNPIVNTPKMIRKSKAPRWDSEILLYQDAAYSLQLTNGIHIRKPLWKYNEGGVWDKGDLSDKRKQSLEILKNKYGLIDKKAKFTFISLISRDEVLEEYFSQIPTLGIPKLTHWLIIIDSDDEYLIEKVKKLSELYEKAFLSKRIAVSNEPNLVNSRDFEERGMRVARNMSVILNQINDYFTATEYVFMVEDDTLAPPKAFPALWKTIAKKKNCVYISGVECGRGYTRHTGVCYLTEEGGEIIGRQIPLCKKRGIELIEGGGWYCWIGRSKQLQNFLFQKKFRCYDGKMLGPDVMMVYDMRQMGYDCYVNYFVQCKHYDSRRKIWLDAKIGKGYDLKYYQEDGLWKINYLAEYDHKDSTTPKYIT